MGPKKLISITFSIWHLRVTSESYTTTRKGQPAAPWLLNEHPENYPRCLVCILWFTWCKPTLNVCFFVKLIYSWKLFFFFKSEWLKPKKPIVKFELTGKHTFQEQPEDKVSRTHPSYHGPIRRRLQLSKYEIKAGVKDKSKSDVQVFSPPQQKSRCQNILTNLYLKFKSYQPCKKGGCICSWSFLHFSSAKTIISSKSFRVSFTIYSKSAVPLRYTHEWDFVPLLCYMEMMKLWLREIKKFDKAHTVSNAQSQDSKQVIPTPCPVSFLYFGDKKQII